MYEPDDIVRSIRRYLGVILPEGPPPDWTIRLERRQVTDEERPVGVILLGDATTIQARETWEQGNVVDLYPVTVYLYPAVEEDAQKARREADAIRSVGHQLLKYGIPLNGIPAAFCNADGRPKAGPFRIPLWDWDGIPSAGPAEGREPPEAAMDVLKLAEGSLEAQNLPDEDDERRRTVVLEFRVELEMPGRIDDRADGGVVTGIEGEFVGEP